MIKRYSPNKRQDRLKTIKDDTTEETIIEIFQETTQTLRPDYSSKEETKAVKMTIAEMFSIVIARNSENLSKKAINVFLVAADTLIKAGDGPKETQSYYLIRLAEAIEGFQFTHNSRRNTQVLTGALTYYQPLNPSGQ